MTGLLGHRSSTSADEGGFTLIELVVACIILALVLIILFAVVLDMFRSGERTRQRNKAQRHVVLVSERLTSDIRAMRAPNRNPKDTTGIEMMREGFTLSDQYKEIHDILLAQPDRLVFFAEVDSVGESGTSADIAKEDLECIEWWVAPNQSVRRTVYPYSENCSGALAKSGSKLDEEVVPPPDAENATDDDFRSIFSYYVTEVPAGSELGTCEEQKIGFEQPVQQVRPFGGEVGRGETPDGSVILPGYGPQQVDRIVAIELDLRSLVSVKGARGEAHFLQKLTIPSRQQYEFRYAIGCAE